MANAVSRAVIEVLLDRMHQGAATLAPDGRLTYGNQRLASMLGQSRAQLVGRPLVELVAEADRETLASALATGRDGAAQCRVSMPRANGGGPGQLQALITFAPLGHGQASCLVTDLTEGKHVSVLAHEVRNMLGTIRNSVELLKRSSVSSDGQRALDTIERHSGRILELMEDLRRVNPRE
ncbi:MAG TPA: histidine kinase dimerization/phospho-acceptor domain-containing protein [Burkholderiales bacterium]|nr:histidine kinase dimerization/phospho-acceptor domain-containing protein [Burkholderiales bacterium]